MKFWNLDEFAMREQVRAIEGVILPFARETRRDPRS
jgi:hypothetical protein